MSGKLWLAGERERYAAEQNRLKAEEAAKKAAYDKVLGDLWEESCRRADEILEKYLKPLCDAKVTYQGRLLSVSRTVWDDDKSKPVVVALRVHDGSIAGIPFDVVTVRIGPRTLKPAVVPHVYPTALDMPDGVQVETELADPRPEKRRETFGLGLIRDGFDPKGVAEFLLGFVDWGSF